MGIFSKLFGRNKNNVNLENNTVYTNPYYNNQNQSNNDSRSTLKLKYNSGTTCDIEFLDVKQIRDENGNLITVQEARLTYMDSNKNFNYKVVALDPIVAQDEHGNSYYATEQYYRDLSIQNISLAKGFFQKDQIDKLENGYIGYIGIDRVKGTPNRSFNSNAKAYYDKKLYEKKRENDMRHKLNEQAYTEEVIAKAAEKEIYIDRYPTGSLTKDDYDRYFGDR